MTVTVAAPSLTERIADHFVAYLFEQYRGTRHVRRVATWIGFILKAVERASGGRMRSSRTRQIVFRYKTRLFKARYSHQAGTRGGIEIVEYFRGRGAPEGHVAIFVTNLAEAEDVYRTLEQRLDAFIDH